MIAQLAIEDDGNLEDGTSAANIALALSQWPVDVIGLNCSSGPRVLLEAIETMAPLTTKPLSVMPNAGLPVTVEGRNLYLCSPEYMAQYARRFIGAGAKIVGGCCGTTPAHIKEIRNEARSLQPGRHAHTVQVEEPKQAPNAQPEDPGGGPQRAGRETGGGQVRHASSRFFRPRASMPPRKSPERSSARTLGSTASMCRTARAPARG